jgi:hypothetical protein
MHYGGFVRYGQEKREIGDHQQYRSGTQGR